MSTTLSTNPTSRVQPDTQRRRFIVSALCGAVPSYLIFLWLAAQGSFNFIARGTNTNFYDAQAISLLHGHLSVPYSAVTIEGIVSHGSIYIYYPPMLALLHLPLMAIDPALSGQQSVISMLLAFGVILACCSILLYRARSLILPSAQEYSTSECVVVAVSVFCLGSGSVAGFLAGFVSVYQETEIWAMAFALMSFCFALQLFLRPSRWMVAFFGLAVFATTMTRITVGAGVLVLAALLAFSHVLVGTSRRLHRPLPNVLATCGLDVEETKPIFPFLLSLCFVVPLILYAAVNYAKFSSLFSVPVGKQIFVTSGLAPPGYAQFARTHLVFNGLQYFPSEILWYLRPDALSLSTLFPFVNFPAHITTVGGVEFGQLTPSSSLTATMPAIVLLAIFGGLALFLPRRFARSSSPGLLRFRPLVLAGVVSSIGIMTYASIAHRYLGDTYPLLVVGTVIAVVLLPTWLSRRRPPVRIISLGVLMVLIVWSVWANFGLALLFEKTFPPQTTISQRSQFTQFRQDLHSAMSDGLSPGVQWGGTLPSIAELGALYVDGSCGSLYEFNGAAWVGLETSRAAGHAIVVATIPSNPTTKPIPLLVSGTENGYVDIIGLTILKNHQYQIVYYSQQYASLLLNNTWLVSDTYTVPASNRVTFDVIINGNQNSALRSVFVSVNNQTVFATSYAISANMVSTIGALPPNLWNDSTLTTMVARRYPAPLTSEQVTTPICSSLVPPKG
ncbi:MAG: hypothetical protein WCG59_09295 [Actinomycetes bacterium]